MRMTRGAWDVWTRGSAMRRAGYAGLRRGVAVALGNWLAPAEVASEEEVDVLREALEDEDPLVRERAQWALQRVRSTNGGWVGAGANGASGGRSGHGGPSRVG